MLQVMGFLWLLASSLSDYGVPAAALAVSVVTLLYSAVAMHRQSKVDVTTHLYDRIDQLEKEIATIERHAEALRKQCVELEKQVRQLREENLDLMRKLIRGDMS